METTKEKLQVIAHEQSDSIRKEVALEALESEDIKSFFTHLLYHGCVSGFVSKLVWYNQTHAFYNKYYNEIENLRHDYKELTGEYPQPNGDLMNWYAWFAFEEITRQLADELGLEY